MKILTGALLTLLAMPAAAQTVGIDNNALSESTSGASTNTVVNNALTLETQNHRKTEVKTAPGHGLAATTNSFSSDYCGGTAQAGVSGPGFSLGGSKQAYDTNCQALRRAEKFGQLAVTAHNLQQHSQSLRLLNMSIFEVCSLDEDTVEMCLEQELVVLRNK